MSCRTTVNSIGQAFSIIKNMAPDDCDWETELNTASRNAMKGLLETAMVGFLDRKLSVLKSLGLDDRRNGSFIRHLLTSSGDIELRVPRTRSFSAVEVLGTIRRRTAAVEQTLLRCFLLGVSTRKVAEVLHPLLGERPSAGTVSRVAGQLDSAVAAFHQRPVRSSYRYLIMDGVSLSMRSGGVRKRRQILVVLGVRHDNRREVLDFAISTGESQAAWEGLLESLRRRGLEGEGLELICCDGGKGLLAALPLIFPQVPVQRCWAHKIRNIYAKVKRTDWPAVKADLHAVCYADSQRLARRAMRLFADRWRQLYPQAVDCLLADEDQLLAFFTIGNAAHRKMVRTTNVIERLFREVRRRTDSMGTFYDRTSIDRIMFSLFSFYNQQRKTGTPFSIMTQKY